MRCAFASSVQPRINRSPTKSNQQQPISPSLPYAQPLPRLLPESTMAPVKETTDHRSDSMLLGHSSKPAELHTRLTTKWYPTERSPRIKPPLGLPSQPLSCSHSINAGQEGMHTGAHMHSSTHTHLHTYSSSNRLSFMALAQVCTTTGEAGSLKASWLAFNKDSWFLFKRGGHKEQA